MLLTLLQSSGAGPSARTITQSARFDNAQAFYGGAVTTLRGVTQASRFDNAQTFYGGLVQNVDEGGDSGGEYIVIFRRRRRL